MTAPPVRLRAGSAGLVRALDRAAGIQVIPGNDVTLLIDGSDTYAAMHAQIAAATHRIHLENYIIHDDGVGQGFADALIAKARAGVKVRVLYDWAGSFGTSRRYWNALREAGIEVRAFGPPRLSDPLLFFARDHRKLLVVDGSRAVTGGLCLGDEWVGDPARSRRPWRDTAVEIIGPAARALDSAFSRAWQFAGGPPPDDSTEIPSEVEEGGETPVRVVATEPGRERAFRTIDLMLGIAGERIWVTEAYLAAPQRMYQAFQDAARDGADVRLLLPGSSDLPTIRNLTRVGYRPLLRAGVRIWEWGGPMLHAKTIVADGRWTRVGSSNLNASSLLANWELDIFIENEALGDAMEQQFRLDLTMAREVLLRPRRLPVLFGREVPGRLSLAAPSGVVPAHHRSRWERVRLAAVIAGGLAQGARAAVFGPLALLLLLVAVAFVLFPGPMAVAAGALTGLAGTALATRALAHRERG
jgi:cardiolipin synthase